MFKLAARSAQHASARQVAQEVNQAPDMLQLILQPRPQGRQATFQSGHPLI